MALTVAVPMRSPRVKALTPNALFSAAAPLALSSTATPVTRVPRPARETFALASESVKAVRRALPALTEIEGVLSTPMVKLVSRTRVEPARSCRPPLWVMVPAAVAGSMVPPVIGKETPLDPALAGVIGVTDTPRPFRALAVPAFSSRVVEPPASLTVAAPAGAATASATRAPAAARRRMRVRVDMPGPPRAGAASVESDCATTGRRS